MAAKDSKRPMKIPRLRTIISHQPLKTPLGVKEEATEGADRQPRVKRYDSILKIILEIKKSLLFKLQK